MYRLKLQTDEDINWLASALRVTLKGFQVYQLVSDNEENVDLCYIDYGDFTKNQAIKIKEMCKERNKAIQSNKLSYLWKCIIKETFKRITLIFKK